MKIAIAFLRLVRWPNLVFIAVTQLLFYYCIVQPVFEGHYLQPALGSTNLVLLIIASVCIAAAGYIINDYFDLNIDRVNKPNRIVIEKVIKRRWAIVWHLLLSLIGVVISFGVSLSLGDNLCFLGFANLICAIALWVYSTTYKRKLLIGNILISVLTAWTVLILYFAQWQHEPVPAGLPMQGELYDQAMAKLFKLAILYSGFAFIISLVREVIKDLEDMDGDMKYGCTTMPIAWGIPVTKVFAGVWIVVLIAVLSIVQFYVVQFDWWWSIAYCFILIVAPLVWIVYKLYQAQNAADYHRLSTVVKLVMFTGILSMLFFRIYQ
jgi:4-hydroxybenzoate polyprenyltransferase